MILLIALALANPTGEASFRSAITAHTPPEPMPLFGSFDAPPVAHWRVKIPGKPPTAASRTERARPAFVGGFVLVGSSTGDALYQLDRRTGVLVRSYPAQASVESEPLVTDGMVYFGDTGGILHAYAFNGDKLWEHDCDAPVIVQPTRHDDLIYVTTVDDLVLALDAQTGDIRWRHQQAPDPTRRAELALYAAPPVLIRGEHAVAGFSDGSIVALTRQEGDVAWQLRVGEGAYPDVVSEPSFVDDVVVAAGYFEPIMAFDADSRRVLWSRPFGSANRPLVYTNEGAAIVLQPGTDGVLRALDLRTGEDVWTWESGREGALSTPVLTDAGVVVASSAGSIAIIDPEDGEPVWRYNPGYIVEGISSAPSVDGRQLVFSTNGGYVVSLVAVRPPIPEAGVNVVPRPADRRSRASGTR